MTDDIIGMKDMGAIFEVTDRFGIDRESVSVPLEKEGDGHVERLSDGSLEITVPASIPTQEWIDTLEAEVKRLGFEISSRPEDEM
ncbi:MAG: hypothetical protein O3A47_00700 [Chloroflexi bacterium]|nr:hypothetical protein [Chloroflexota bacterium]